MEKWKSFFQTKWFRKDNLIILILGGVLLFIIALPVKDTEPQTTRDEDVWWDGTDQSETGNTEADTTVRTAQTATGSQEYAAYLEEKLSSLLSGMEGAGKVEVMITLQASEELVVEKDETLSRANTNEEDTQGGKRVITQLDTGETTVYDSDGSASTPYVVKTILPQVEGVVVVAQGAGSGTVNKNIVEAVQALFHVEAHKIKVVKMESGNLSGE